MKFSQKFSEWLKLQEMGTGTNAIAVFARPVTGMISRKLFPSWGDDEPKKKRKRKRKRRRS